MELPAIALGKSLGNMYADAARDAAVRPTSRPPSRTSATTSTGVLGGRLKRSRAKVRVGPSNYPVSAA